MPSVSPTTLYIYLAEGVGNAKVSQAFRALKRGYIHWASGRLSKILKKVRVGDQVIGSVCQASCECAAG